MFGAGHHQMRPGAQQAAEFLDRGIGNNRIASGSDDQDRLADLRYRSDIGWQTWREKRHRLANLSLAHAFTPIDLQVSIATL